MSEELNTSIESPSIDDSDGPELEYPSFNSDKAKEARDERRKSLEEQEIARGDNYKTSSAIMTLYKRYLINAERYRRERERLSREADEKRLSGTDSRELSRQALIMQKNAETDEASAKALEKILREEYGITLDSSDSVEETKKAS